MNIFTYFLLAAYIVCILLILAGIAITVYETWKD